MGQKKKPKDKKKNPKSTKWSTKLYTVSKARQSGVFRWEISNFTQVNAHYVFSDYFELCGMRFVLQLFPKGEARNTPRKYMGLYLQLEEGDAAVLSAIPSVFVCSQLAVVNHADDTKHVSKYIFHRYAYDSKSSGQKEFMSLDSLKGPESEFLLNGTGLHILVDALVLDDSWSFEELPLPQEHQKDEEVASQVEGAYGGKFTWTIENYSLFHERFKNNGMLNSHFFPIGESQYRIHLESQKYCQHITNEYCLSMFLDNVSGDHEQDKNAWCLLIVKLTNKKQEKPETVCKAYGRLGIDVIGGAECLRGWLNLMDMSDFENPDNGFIMNDGKVRVILYFVALKERDNFQQITEDSKNIWFLGEGSKPPSKSKKKIAEKVLSKFFWEIHNFPVLVNFLRKCDMEEVRIESRRTRIGQTETRLMLLPLGSVDYQDEVGLVLENLNPDLRFLKEETSFVAHYRLRIENQIDPKNTKVVEDMCRFGKEEYYGNPNLLSQSDFYSESGGYIVNGKIRMFADVRVLDEKLEISDLVEPTDDGEKMQKLVRWKVDNFLAWPEVGGPVDSRFFEVGECYFSICTIVYPNLDLAISLRCDPCLVAARLFFEVEFRLGMLNQRYSNRNLWRRIVYTTNKDQEVILIGNITSLVKEEGYVVKDKILFGCEFYRCVRYIP